MTQEQKPKDSNVRGRKARDPGLDRTVKHVQEERSPQRREEKLGTAAVQNGVYRKWRQRRRWKQQNGAHRPIGHAGMRHGKKRRRGHM